MSIPRPPQPAKLIAGLLYREADLHRQVLQVLQESFGSMDLLTEPEPFTCTSYYNREGLPDSSRILRQDEPV